MVQSTEHFALLCLLPLCVDDSLVVLASSRVRCADKRKVFKSISKELLKEVSDKQAKNLIRIKYMYAQCYILPMSTVERGSGRSNAIEQL